MAYILDVTEFARMVEGRGAYLFQAGEEDLEWAADEAFDMTCGDRGARIPVLHKASVDVYEVPDDRLHAEMDEDGERIEVEARWRCGKMDAEPVFVCPDDMKKVKTFYYNCDGEPCL